MVNKAIKQLVDYGIRAGLIELVDAIYVTNQLIDVLKLVEYQEPEISDDELDLEQILMSLLEFACHQGIIEDNLVERDLLDTRLMNCLMPRPGEIIRQFWDKYQSSSLSATNYFYQLSQDSDYIRRYRINKDIKWITNTKYGALDITINLSKPEKDPKAIAAAKMAKPGGYPKCLLCKENEGYAGRMDHPARNNHRIIPIMMDNCQWGFQYSPYVYYPEHCIVFHGQHIPMKIDQQTFVKLFDFIQLFPHYFLGSNADLPIVGGSILTHDHFQGGHYTFAMARAPLESRFVATGYDEVEAGIVYWPMSVLRLKSKNVNQIIDLGTKVLSAWREYSDADAMIYAQTEGEPHNTITPIARKSGDDYELDLVLRNNLVTAEFPDGLYHPHPHLHHIKKENIGLIEVMGLAVLPPRLKFELNQLAIAMLDGREIELDEELKKHAQWTKDIKEKQINLTENNIMDILKEEVGKVFEQVLEDAGVFKCTPTGRTYFTKFLLNAGFNPVTTKRL